LLRTVVALLFGLTQIKIDQPDNFFYRGLIGRVEGT